MNRKLSDKQALCIIPIIFYAFAVVLPIIYLGYYAFFMPSNKASKSLFYYVINEPYFSVFVNTFSISIKVSMIVVIVSIFITFTILTSPKKIQSYFLFYIIASMWLSIIVRSYAWILILQNNGILNNFLYWFLPEYSRKSYMYNQYSVILGMVHILAPYVILIQWSAIKDRYDLFERISNSLGGSPSFCFYMIYLPFSINALIIGGFIVFLLSLGYFITPLLLGTGSHDTIMIAMLIEEHVNTFANWKVGSLISINLLTIVTILMLIILSIPKINKLLFNYIK
jgi:ABC-type spermidine/putrescine transport system permease subunit I